jgi:tripartite-type tricarboxylate transporter receptor subunit TctC
VIENVGGAGGSMASRVARAAPMATPFDIGQWDTHVGSIIWQARLRPRKGFRADRACFQQSPAHGCQERPAGEYAWRAGDVDEGKPRQDHFVNQNAAANVTGVLFENLTKQKVQFIPYRGAGPAMTDLISGTVDLLVVQGAMALPQIRAGKIKALANLSAMRSASMPDIPTADETGIPGLYMSGWFGFWAPKGTPKDIIAKLNAATTEALADPEFRSGSRAGA